MKKILAVLALAAALLPAAALAQSSIIGQIAGDQAASERLYFSLKFGLNMAHLTASPGLGRTGGFNFGLAATIKLGPRLSLVPEILLFSRKGVSNIPFVPTGDPALDPYFVDPETAELALIYTDLPVLVTYRLGRFLVGAGPVVSYLGAADERFKAVLPTGETLRYARETTTDYRRTDVGLAVEGAWTITKPRRGVGLVFHFRYVGGLVGVLRAPGPSGQRRNSALQVSIGFPFVR